MNIFRRKPKLSKTPKGKLRRILQDHNVDLVFDIGANIGQTGVELREAGYEGQIVSFEPVPNAHAALLDRAQRDPKWHVAPRTAVGDTAGEVTLNVAQASDLSSVLEPTPELCAALQNAVARTQVVVPMTTLDDIWTAYCTSETRAFAKIDTQGSERRVLQGARRSLERLIGLKLELSLVPIYEGEETYLSYLQDLHAWGFSPFMLHEGYFSRTLGRQLQIDCVFMRP